MKLAALMFLGGGLLFTIAAIFIQSVKEKKREEDARKERIINLD